MVSAPVKLDEALKTFLHFTARWEREREMAEGNEEASGSGVIDTTSPPPWSLSQPLHQAKQTNNNGTNNAEVIDIPDEVEHKPPAGLRTCLFVHAPSSYLHAV